MNFTHFNHQAIPEDLAAIDRLISPPGPPERIYNWLNGQMSVARFYGGLTYQGQRYVIDYSADGNPLVRADIFDKEQRASLEENRAALRGKQAAEKLQADKQGAMF